MLYDGEEKCYNRLSSLCPLRKGGGITLERPTLAITLGDAAGIGPEIAVKALAQKEIYSLCCPLVVGTAGAIEQAAQSLESRLRLHSIDAPTQAEGHFGTIDVLDLHNLDLQEVTVGQVCPAAGKAAMEWIIEAAQLAQRGEVGALVTAPINKEATKLGGYQDIGHLELLARLTGAKEYATMLMAGPLRVVHLTTHRSLRQACDEVTMERVLARLQLTHRCFQEWGLQDPRIAVAALNPHASEGGLFGSEEGEEIAPAVRAAQDQGIRAQGPLPADSVFHRAIAGEFDVVLAMYHDQGHIPVKVHDFERSVSVALGLPFVRTSVDHGTAFDIAGKGIAKPQSLIEAIKVAAKLCTRRGLTQ